MSFNREQPAHISLRELIGTRANSLIAWVGSGVSASAGLPGWEKLRDQLVQAIQAKHKDDEENDFKRLSAKLTSADEMSRKQVGKYIPDKSHEAEAALRHSLWEVLTKQVSIGNMAISARTRLDNIADSIETLARGARAAMEAFKFN
jgi:hypothetical protein